MTRFITNIKKKTIKSNEQEDGISVAILAAGCGSKIKSYEPRSLLKVKDKILINHQIDTIKNTFNKVEILATIGCYADKIIRKIRGRAKIVENQLHSQTNSSESLRLAFNNSINDNFMFIHGDIWFNEKCLKVDYSQSFVIINSDKMIKDHEIGVTMINDNLSIMSYGLPVKWAQIAFFTGKEYKILNNLFNKFENKEKKKLSFEIINEIVNRGGVFKCYEPHGMKVKEIDRIRDIE